MTDPDTQSLRSRRDLYPHYTEEQLLDANHRLERYLKHSLENYRWLKHNPKNYSRFRKLISQHG
jgi:hypothetical protein